MDEIAESHAQLRGAWRLYAEQSPRGVVLERPEVVIASANADWFVFNTCWVPRPVDSEAVLEEAAASAASYFHPRRLGWVLALGEEQVAPALWPRVPELLRAYGLVHTTELVGMVAERLRPPERPLPELELREAVSAAEWRAFSELNTVAYALPPGLGREVLEAEGMYRGRARGYVGCLQGQATSCTGVYEVQGVAYISMVATHPAWRRQAHAEVLIRHALAQARRTWGLERSVLHATPAGSSLYQHLGYRPVARFLFYLAPPPALPLPRGEA
jgi:ribosomal protein S18 acetylase RimI-like enzyme